MLMKPASGVAFVFLTIVSIAHLLRFLMRLEVLVGGMVIPVWMSLIACVAMAMLAIALWRESHPPQRRAPRDS
jgi:hypothetical protein